MNEYLSADFLKFFIPLVGAVVAWILNERRRRTWEEYLRKEDRYRELLKSLSGFYEHSANADYQNDFFEEYKKCWMYCADDVIKAANAAMSVIAQGSEASLDERRRVIGGFVLAVRRDLLRRRLVTTTQLHPEDYIQVLPGKSDA